MAHHQLGVFGDLHVVDAEVNRHLRQLQAAAAGEGQDREGADLHGGGGLQGTHHIGGIAAAGKHDQQITRPALHLQLVGVDVGVARVVGQAGDHAGIGGQRIHPQPRQRGARAAGARAVVEVVGHVHGVGRTAAVAADEHLTPIDPGLAQLVGQLFHGREDLDAETTLQPLQVGAGGQGETALGEGHGVGGRS